MFYGHQAALIGASVFCHACRSVGLIAKAGGPRRSMHHGDEIALDGDVLLCGCGQPPRMIASMQRFAWCDDLAETMGAVTSASTASGGVTSVVVSNYDEQIEAGQQAPADGYPYFIETDDGRVFSGRLDAGRCLPRVCSEGSASYAVFWGDEALGKTSWGVSDAE
jgi:hypothetical protein